MLFSLPLHAYAELRDSELNALYERRRSTRVVLPADVANVGDLSHGSPASDAPGYVDIPPSPVILDGSTAHAIYTLAGSDIQGKWTRTLVLVYRLGGRVFYRKHSERDVEALIYFREPREGDRVSLAFGRRPIVRVTEHEVEVCQTEYCVPSALAHSHTVFNRGWLFWDENEGVWTLIGKRK